MKYYAVIDTNVLVSAMLKWNSVPGNVMRLVFEGPIVPLLDERIVKEYRDVLVRPKFETRQEIGLEMRGKKCYSRNGRNQKTKIFEEIEKKRKG